MYKLYYIVTNLSDRYYIGMTKRKLSERFSGHKHSCKRGVKTKLYSYMRKYGVENFEIVLMDTFETREECCLAEKQYISEARERNDNILNLSEGGEGGFVVQDREAWIKKLSEARKGSRPALGMKHTEENKKIFSEVSNKYWETQKTYNPNEVLRHPFKKAKRKFGISKTHYYRLKKTVTE